MAVERREGDVLAHSERHDEPFVPAVLGEQRNSPGDRVGGGAHSHGCAADLDRPGRGSIGAKDHPHDLRPTGADEPCETEDLSGVKLERDVVDERRPLQPMHPQERRRLTVATRRRRREPRGPVTTGDRVDERLLVHFMSVPLERDRSVLHDDDAVRQRDDLVQPVGDVDDRVPALLQLADDRVQVADLLDRQRDARLVEEEHAGVVVEGARDHHEPLLDGRQVADVRTRVDPRLENVEDRAHAPAQLLLRDEDGESSRVARTERDVLGDGDRREVTQLLMDEGEAETVRDVRRISCRQRLAVDVHLARVGPLDTREDLDQAALAGSVLADESDDLARPNLHVDAGECDDARKLLHESAHADDGTGLVARHRCNM